MRAALDRLVAASLPVGEALRNHDQTVFGSRARRDLAVGEVPDFAELCERGRAIKAHALDHLDEYLERFEARLRERGAVVHWAGDAAALRGLVHRLLRERDVTRVVKSKSMLTEECRLNPYLEEHGIEVIDTDLGERIVQLAEEPPSHIVYPAVHWTRSDVGELFHRKIGSPAGEQDAQRLTYQARKHLRQHFLRAQAGITGVNFAVAETGSIVVCTNEGNADLGMSLPPLHIACMGIEKIVPTLDDLGVFLRLLARSATGQPITAYTTLVSAPRPGAELHVCVVDNGRTSLLEDARHRASLSCIRCGACLNTCPVYRRAGGHAYGQTVPGPIGAVLAPRLFADANPHARELPFASTLCGSCTAVCPLRIDLHEQMLAWRASDPRRRGLRRAALRATAAVLARPRLYRLATRLGRRLWPLLARNWPLNPARGWLWGRELPEAPAESFAERHARERVRR